MYTGLHTEYSPVLSDFNKTCIFSTDLRKKIKQMPNFMEIRPVGTELFNADGQTETKAAMACSHFSNAPKKRHLYALLVVFNRVCRDLYGAPSEILQGLP
jgi:hypothetical protein